jgi:hypothetical protein
MAVATACLQSMPERFSIHSPFNSFCRPRRCAPMSSPGSVTHWLDQLRIGEAAAARHLWEGYFHRLVSLPLCFVFFTRPIRRAHDGRRAVVGS